MLSEEQTIQVKEQLINQIETTFPEDKKDSAISQIEAMNSIQLEEFLVQNNLVKTSASEKESKEKGQIQCIFCSIIKGEIPSYKIDENKQSIAVLEINPVSKGHVLILPKSHISKSSSMPQSAFSLAKKISKKLQKLKPREVKIESSNFFGHEILNVFPVYENENLNSKREKADKKQLEILQKKLEKKSTKSKPKIRQKLAKEIKQEFRIPIRIP